MKRLLDYFSHPRLWVFIYDALMIPIAWGIAYAIRFNLEGIPEHFFKIGWDHLVHIVMPVQISFFWLFGLYRGIWRFASLPDIWRIIKAVLVGTLFISLIIGLTSDFIGTPRTVPILYAIFLAIILSLSRGIYRLIKDGRRRGKEAKRVLIIGAGAAGEALVRDLLRHGREDYLPVAFIDDDPHKQRLDIHGIRVLGRSDQIETIAKKLAIDLIILAVPSADRQQMDHLVKAIEKTGLPFRTIPPLRELMHHEISLKQLRKPRIEDLLGRDPIHLDWQGIKQGLAHKRILITGAGGSIGSELCRQLSRLSPKQLILVDHAEYPLFQIEQELKKQKIDFYCHLSNVTDALGMDYLFQYYRPQVVFHAAAYKHVPLLQYQLREALYNNVIGTKQVADAAQKWGVEEFILISTDKAVNPSNIMGMSKRLAEIYCQIKNENSSTRYITVRFGNVLGSTGSVVPIFQKQIEQGGPVTVTHPDMQRYFMTVQEACQLIMQASVLGKGNEIFVLDMGEPVSILYLAEQMIRLNGYHPYTDIAIEITQPRPGEKLKEELFYQQENLSDTEHDKIMQAASIDIDVKQFHQLIIAMEQACLDYDCDALQNLLAQALSPAWSKQSLSPICTL